MSRQEELIAKFESGFFGFWIKQYRISYLIVIALIAMGTVAAINIPKESSPSIELGIISIGTSYFGTNPIDMDSLITSKLYKEIKDIKGVDKIESSSSLGFSSVILTLRAEADIKDVVSDVRSAVARVNLPADAKSPVITEIETDTNRTFSLYLYSEDKNVSKSILIDRAKILQDELEWLSGVNSIDLAVGGISGPVSTGWWDDSAYDVYITVPEKDLEVLWLTLSAVSNTIQSYNRDQPIGNFTLGEKKYDFRIEGKKTKSFDFLTFPIALPNGGTVTLGEIGTIERKYKNTAKNILVLSQPEIPCEGSLSPETCTTGHSYVGLTLNKTDSVSIFDVSDRAKTLIDTVMERDEFQWFSRVYATDLADTIRDDYVTLANNAISTLILVFLAMFIFVGFRDALFALIALPLAFLTTFIFLDAFGFTMNFLTNFSLIVSLGIAIDTVIVIVEAASVNLKIWFSPRTAITLALRTYAVPVISGVMTTIVVFLPMMVLPGVLGKFMAYIPITIFGVLAFGLLLVLTVNNAIYILFNKERDYYTEDVHRMEFMSEDEKELLMLERVWKENRSAVDHSWRVRLFTSIENTYRRTITPLLEKKYTRMLLIFVPVFFLIFSIINIAPKVGFTLFPSDDNSFTSFNIVGPTGQITEKTVEDLIWIEWALVGYPEVEYSNITISKNKANIAVQLTKKKIRQSNDERDVYAIEKDILLKLSFYEQKWYSVTSEIQENGPPSGKAIGIKLVADSPEWLDSLIQVSKEFETYLNDFAGSKNVGRSSSDAPWQFIFRLNKELIASTGISPSLIYSQMLQNMNGINLWSIEDNGTDMSLYLKSSKFGDTIQLEDVLAIPISLGQTKYLVGDFVESQISNSLLSISRENWDIQITVDADLETGVDTIASQTRYVEFAKSYAYPRWISYQAGGENEANAELIVAVITAFWLSLLAIFAILTLQFQSFSQPLIILYSAIMAVPFVMIGLILTNNPFSLTFGIGFIAFTGIAVNDAIVLLSAINENIKKWMTWVHVLVESAASRLQPIMLTTVTTVLGIYPIAMQDKFWSGLGFTIIFGIIAASTLTLFSIQAIYYELYLDDKPGIFRRIGKSIWSLVHKKRKRI